MTMFWLIAALFLLGALMFVLPGLLKPEWAASSAESASAQAAPPLGTQPARRTALVLAFVLPLGAVLGYLALGEPAALEPAAPARAAHSDARNPDQLRQTIAALTERLKAQPDDAQAWLMLGHAYTALGRFNDGVLALRRGSRLLPGNATVLADLADVLAMTQGKRLRGEPAQIAQQALDVDPRHPKALALAGSAAFEAQDYAAARAFWERLLPLVAAGSEMERSVRSNIAQTLQLEGGTTMQASSVQGEVRLSPELSSRLGAGDTLFVFARAAQGPRMPLAIWRRPAGLGPMAFTLDDSMAMAPNLKLSGQAQLEIGARVSRSGQALPQPGDLVGQPVAAAPGARKLVILIDRVQP